MDLELLTIGDELLLGFTVDTNGPHIARTLAELGVRIVHRATVGDNPDEIAAAINAALERTGAVLSTGGLGPTADDRTHESAALAFGRPLVLNETGLAELEARWRERFGRQMPESNRRQMFIPEGATLIANRHGSAPGIWIEDAAGRWMATLPGVPREMRGMLSDQIVPRLRDRLSQRGAPLSVVRSRTLRTIGIAESALADRLAEFSGAVHDVPLSYLPGIDGVDLRLTVQGVAPDAADAALARAATTVLERVGAHVYGEGSDSLPLLAVLALRERGHTLAVAESCTGGMLGARITSVPGASAVFHGGVIAYDNAVKVEQLGVDASVIAEHGAVSEAVARAMASGVRARLGTDVGIGITGIAGPNGGTPEKPVGTVWIAVDVRGRVHAVKPVLPGDREEIRYRATQLAFDRLRRAYAGTSDAPAWLVAATAPDESSSSMR